jgi:ABC-type molybdenum transport system ATPase subunit/photorepair protein PhrA
MMKRFGLERLAAKRVGEMSYGEFRKMLLLRALIHDPQLLLCDEPFDGLDAGARQAFRGMLESVARRGTQLVIVTHHVDELPACITNKLDFGFGGLKKGGPFGPPRS